ncbi:hypothetical protein CAEBREN_13170 [Caenorhabditis brenneri]|uniref:Uncharacterized protein n=1 Tax=Caenorhabditis brenneri TaxID=135651 RepID=G0NBS5_CAEBE|nr:hypothetical protein CAEBREN_13170 [Caenorhabditis brenneri]
MNLGIGIERGRKGDGEMKNWI